ncbi:MAG: hypothetical protein NT074_08875 [Methanomicrobiales archaeon]|nr:hypothetical protein [Methanomicrobiales archaeon]
MDPKSAVKTYQFAERAKSELIIAAQLTTAFAGFPEGERAGGKRMLLLLFDAVRSETEFAIKITGDQEFRRASDRMSEAISLIESDNYGAASLKVSEGISAATTSAQAAWQVLSTHGLL